MSPLHVATPGARKDAGPSRRRGRRRSRRRSGRRSQSATRKSPLHPPRFGSAQAMAGGRWRRSGEGDHKGRPYESFDSGDAMVPLMDNPRPVSRGIMPEARRGDFQSPTGRAVSSRPVGPIPDDRRGTPCGCLAGSHRSPAESPPCRRSTSPRPAPGRTPVPVGAEDDAAPDAAPDADPSRRLESRRSTPPRFGSAQAMAGGRWRRSGEGDHKGRPYESFDSGSAVGVADGQSPSFPRDHAGGPAVGDFLEKHGAPGGGTFLSPSSLRLLSLGPGGDGVGRIGGGTFQSPRGSGGRKTPTPLIQRTDRLRRDGGGAMAYDVGFQVTGR